MFAPHCFSGVETEEQGCPCSTHMAESGSPLLGKACIFRLCLKCGDGGGLGHPVVFILTKTF